MPRYLPPPKGPVPPDALAVRVAERITAYLTEPTLTPVQRALGAHHIAYSAARAFARALYEARLSGVTWAVLAASHGLAVSSLQWRVYDYEGRELAPSRRRRGKRGGQQ